MLDVAESIDLGMLLLEDVLQDKLEVVDLGRNLFNILIDIGVGTRMIPQRGDDHHDIGHRRKLDDHVRTNCAFGFPPVMLFA